MSWDSDSETLSVIAVFLVSLISGFISIAQRIARGAVVTFLWVASEFLAALLCGYLMWDAYPKIAPSLPDWCTLWVMVAAAAHIGGRGLQTLENAVIKRYEKAIANS